jgi:hypothetical protein
VALTQQEDFPFPVSDDPTDPTVLAYWAEVARRIALAPLPPELRSWAEAIDGRITEFHAATAALEAARKKNGADVDGESKRYAAAVFEFKRIKWKLSTHFGWHFKITDPTLLLLFGKGPQGKQN